MRSPMKKLIVLATLLAGCTSPHGHSVAGTWNGTLAPDGARLRVVFHITRNGDALQATMDSPDQGAKGLPVSAVSYEPPR